MAKKHSNLKQILLTGSLIIGSHFWVGGCGGRGGGSTYIPPENKAPIITVDNSNVTISRKTATINQEINDYDATDPEGKTVTFSKVSGPEYVDIGSTNGTVTLNRVPLISEEGLSTLVVRASDGVKTSDLESTINVIGNASPVITSSADLDAVEGENYYYDCNATDSDLDTLTYSLGTHPTGMTINSLTGEINWTPTDAQSGTTFSYTVNVTDGEAVTSQTVNGNTVINTETISGNLKDAYTNTNVSGIEVLVGSYSGVTDINGNWTISGVRDGDHQVIINSSSGGNASYQEYFPGNWVSNKTNVTNVNDVLAPTNNHSSFVGKNVEKFFQECLFGNGGEIRKWAQKPHFNIYTKEASAGTDVPGTTIDMVRDVIKNELTEWYQGKYVFTDSDITLINTTPLIGQPADGDVKVYWYDLVAVGGVVTYFGVDKKIISGSTSAYNGASKSVWLEELTSAQVGTASESEELNSVLNDDAVGGPENDYTPEDKMLYRYFSKRPHKTTFPDNTPLGYQYNQ